MSSSYSIYTQEPKVAPPKPRKPLWNKTTQRVSTITGILLLIVLLTTGSIWAYRAHEKSQIIAALEKEPDFRKAREIVDSGKLTRDEMRDVMEHAWDARTDKQVDGYFVLPIGAQRNAYLDKQIDEMQARMKEWQSRSTTQPDRRNWRGQGGPTSGPTSRPGRGDIAQQVSRMRSRMESGNPTRQAQRSAFMSAMRARMTQRGIQGGPGGGGRGFGGGGFGGGGFGGGGRGGSGR